MRCGLYGKLPTKRDFIAEYIPPGFLPGFEPWLQGAVGTSRMTMGSTWQDIYLQAPIWRFWLGANICGKPTIGAFMPSIDGVGRFFPLVLMAAADDGQLIPPPFSDSQSNWFDMIENFLLSTLADGVDFRALIAALAQLPPARQIPMPPEQTNLFKHTDGTLIYTQPNAGVDDAFHELRSADEAYTLTADTFWWTIGGEAFPTAAIACRGLPDARLFSGFLTGQFDAV